MIATPEPDATAADAPKPARRGRPVLVELASAMLIVSAVLNLLLSIQAIAAMGEQGQQVGALTLITIGLTVATLALGVLVRFGHAWLVAVNVVAIVAFLELMSGDPIGLLFGVVDTVVVIALLVERPWFVSQSREPEPESDLRSYGG